MTIINLESARAKLRRAHHHRNDLEQKVNAFLDNPENWAVLSAELDQESGHHIFRITNVPTYDELVQEISLIVGDVIHCLRCTLDHLAWQLANAHAAMNEPEARRVQFPIVNDAVKFQNSPAIARYSQFDWAQMEEFQPFKGTNNRSDSWSGDYIHQLEHLQELSNSDKHRQLSIVMLTSSQISTIEVEGGRPPWLVNNNGEWTMDATKINDPNPWAAPPNFNHSSFLVEIGAEVVRYKLTSHFARQSTIEVAGTVMPSVALADLRPILPTLDRIAAFVELVLNEFSIRLQADGRM